MALFVVTTTVGYEYSFSPSTVTNKDPMSIRKRQATIRNIPSFDKILEHRDDFALHHGMA